MFFRKKIYGVESHIVRNPFPVYCLDQQIIDCTKCKVQDDTKNGNFWKTQQKLKK